MACLHFAGSGDSSGRWSGTVARNTGTSVASSSLASRSTAFSAESESVSPMNGNRIRRAPEVIRGERAATPVIRSTSTVSATTNSTAGITRSQIIGRLR